MPFDLKAIKNFIFFLSTFSILYMFSVETFLRVHTPAEFPIITILMSVLISALIITDFKSRGTYFTEILAMLKPKRLSKQQLVVTLTLAAILCALLVLVKYITITYFLYYFPFSSNQMQLFSGNLMDLGSNIHSKDLIVTSVFMYALSCIFQEFIARCWLHDSFSMIFNNKYVPIFATSGYFGAAHLHMTAWIGVLVFVLSMIWGFLYTYTNRSLYAVILCHAIVGIFAFNILGFPFQLIFGNQ